MIRRCTDILKGPKISITSFSSKTISATASSDELKVKSSELLLNKYSILGGGPGKKAVKSINQSGFKINNVSIKGPAIVLNEELFLWDVPQFGVGGKSGDVEPVVNDGWSDPSSPFYGWTPRMFKIFEVVEKKPEMLLVGTGGALHLLPPPLRKYINDLGIQLDVMNSRQAGSTFNVLSEEGRNVALAVLPPIPTSSRTGNALVEVRSQST